MSSEQSESTSSSSSSSSKSISLNEEEELKKIEEIRRRISAKQDYVLGKSQELPSFAETNRGKVPNPPPPAPPSNIPNNNGLGINPSVAAPVVANNRPAPPPLQSIQPPKPLPSETPRATNVQEPEDYPNGGNAPVDQYNDNISPYTGAEVTLPDIQEVKPEADQNIINLPYEEVKKDPKFFIDETYHPKKAKVEDESKWYNKKLVIDKTKKFYLAYLVPIITSAITLSLFIASIISYGVTKDRIVPLLVVTQSVPVINMSYNFFLWVMHCLALIGLPWLLIYTFGKVKYFYIYSTPVMMFLNFLGNFIPGGYCSIPLIIEFILVMLFILYLPFRHVYRYKEKDFLFAEGLYLALGFIYVSVASGAGSFSYVLFGPSIRHPESGAYQLVEDPYIAYDIYNYYYENEMPIQGYYLAVFSFFGIIIIGLGFAMTFHNSIGLSIPFFFIAVGVCCRTVSLGMVMMFQFFIHLIYMCCLYCEKGRYFLGGSGKEGFRSMGNQLLSTVMIGTIISLLVFAFPVLTLCSSTKIFDNAWNWGAFFGTSVVGASNVFLNYLFVSNSQSILYAFLIPITMAITTLAGGIGWCGKSMFVSAFTYQLTYLCWTLALCFWAYTSGFSPVIFKFYSSLIAIASIIVVDCFDGFGWVELIFAIAQVLVDSIGMEFFRKKEAKLIGWTLFSIVGFLILAVVGTVILVVIVYVVYYIVYCCCKIQIFMSDEEQRAREAAHKAGLSPGDRFIYNGVEYTY